MERASVSAADAGGHSEVVKRSVLKSEGDETQVCVCVCVSCIYLCSLFFKKITDGNLCSVNCVYIKNI